MTRENAVAGQTEEACGMESSTIKVGTRTLNPETKNSVRICDIIMLKRKHISDQIVGNVGGRWRPRRSIRASSDSSIGASCLTCFSVSDTEGSRVAVSFSMH